MFDVMKGKMMLTFREFQIANKILSVQSGIRIKDLAAEFQVSPRTIQYDLENVKDFINDQGVSFCSSPRKGIWVEGTGPQRETALAELSRLQTDSVYFNQEMRMQRILLQLVLADGYITASALAEKLNVSRGTILSDMDDIEMFLQDNEILLRRKVRQGYRLDGQELTLRTLAENLIQDSISVYHIYQIISRLKSGSPSGIFTGLLTGLALQDFNMIEKAMVTAFKDYPDKLSKENSVLLMTRLFISLSRMRMGHFVGNPTQPADEDMHYLYPYWETVYRQNSLPMLKDELGYLLGHYQADKISIDIIALGIDLVESVSRMEDFPYYEDEMLYPRLLSHLRRCFSDEKKDIARNPLHDTILKNHKHLYKSIRWVCKEHIDSSCLLFNDSLISYLVLYFLMAQRNLGVGRKKRVVFVCATGQGVAKIIARMIEVEVRRIEIVQHCTLSEIDEVEKNIKPDFIISIFPIESTVPVVVVQPLPTKSDIEAVNRLVEANSDPDELWYNSQMMDYRMDYNNQEETSQEAIVVGLRIYAKLCEEKTCNVKPGLEFAFLTHVMLLANRYVFNKQFKNKSVKWTGLDLLIKNSLEEMGVYLEMDEIKALTYYIDCVQPYRTG